MVANAACSSVIAQVQIPQHIDFAQVLARLVNIDAERESFSRTAAPPSPSPPPQEPARLPTPSPEPDAGKAYETNCYHDLVSSGGRPPVPLDLLDAIYKDFALFTERLEPWQERPVCLSAGDLGVFSRPLARWKAFQRWQHNNRGEAVSAGDTLMGFRQQKQHHYESMGLAQLITDPDFDETIQRMWEQEQVRCRRERDKVREAAAGSFSEYADAARRRLCRHGFTEDFHLLEDPQQQDQRLTWIEYLKFEYWWLDKRTNSVGAAQKQHERAWEEIVESGILRPGETREHLLASSAECATDGKPLHTLHSISQKASRRLLIGRLMRTARACEDAKAAESRQLRLVQWALTQMPGNPKPPSAEPTKKGNKRRRQEDDDDAVDRPMKPPTTKRQRQDDKRVTGGTTRHRAVPRTRLTVGLMLPVKEPRVKTDQGHRRSARIRNLPARLP